MRESFIIKPVKGGSPAIASILKSIIVFSKLYFVNKKSLILLAFINDKVIKIVEVIAE